MPTILGIERYALLTKISLSAVTWTNCIEFSGGGDNSILSPGSRILRSSVSPSPKFTRMLVRGLEPVF